MTSERRLRVGVEYAWGNAECDLVRDGLLASPKCAYPGIESELIGSVLRDSGIPYSLHVLPTNIDEHMASIVNGTIDLMGTGLWSVSTKRMDTGVQFTSTVPWERTFSALLVDRDPNDRTIEMSNLNPYTNVYTPHTWLCVAVVYLFYKAYLYSARLFSSSRKQVLHVLLDLLAAFALGLFGNSLLANILVASPTLTFTDYESMLTAVSAGKIKMMILPGIGWYEDIMNSPYSKFKSFQDLCRKHPPHEESNVTRVYELIASGEYLYMSSSTTISSMSVKQCYSHAIELKQLGDIAFAIMFSPHTPHEIVRDIDELLLMSNWHLSYLDKKYKGHGERQAKLDCRRPHSNTISFSSAIVVIFVVLASYLIASLGLLFEYLFAKAKLVFG